MQDFFYREKDFCSCPRLSQTPWTIVTYRVCKGCSQGGEADSHSTAMISAGEDDVNTEHNYVASYNRSRPQCLLPRLDLNTIVSATRLPECPPLEVSRILEH